MKFLLDTHTLIWYYEDLPDLPDRIKHIIEDTSNEIYISYISLWEIAIKLKINKLQISWSIDELYNDIIKRDFNLLQFKKDYLNIYLELPLIHREPFDRILVATSISENLTFLTKDENIHKYDVKCLWN
jgi:PIN domain nuclease of toxin-antitoxin system